MPPRYPPGLPPEAHEEWDRNRMEFEDNQRRVIEFVRTQDRATLVLLKGLFHSCAENQYWSPYYEGLMTAGVITRFEWCPSCGGDHAIHPEEGMPSEVQSKLQETVPEFEPDPNQEIRDAFNARLDEYRLKPSEQHNGVGFECRDCGLFYVSLKDRMLKPPSECHGCFDKAAHG